MTTTAQTRIRASHWSWLWVIWCTSGRAAWAQNNSSIGSATTNNSTIAAVALAFICAIIWVVILSRRVSAHKRTQLELQEKEMRLRHSEALYQSLVQHLPVCVLRKNLVGRFVFANDLFLKTIGKALEEVLGKTDRDLFPNELAEKYQQDDRQVIATGQVLELVERHRKGADETIVQVWKTPVRDPNGEIIGVQVLFWDVSERERMKQELATERDLLETLLKNIPDRVYFKDKESRFVKCSDAVAAGLEAHGASEVVGKTDAYFFTEEHARAAFEDEQRIMQTGQPVIGLVEKETWHDGSVSWVLTTKMPWRNQEGEIVGTFGISKDITELKKVEAELAYERELFHSLLDSVPDLIYFKDRESRFVQISRAMAERFKVDTSEEVIGKTDFDFYTKQHAQEAYNDEQEIMRTGKPLFGKLEEETHADGRVTYVLTSKMPWRNSQGEIIGTFGTSKDITELRRAEAELAYEREQFRALLDNIPDCIYFKDLDSRFVRVSRALAERFHLGEVELAMGRTDFDFFDKSHANEAFQDEQRIIRTGEPIIGKLEKETYPDGRVTWALSTKMPWRNHDGEIVGTFGISRNVTELKQAEERLEQVHRQLVAASRSAGMAEVATGVLHNVGNVLNSVNVSANIIKDRLRSSRMPTLSKVVELLRANTANLGEFITRDDRGRQIPYYLEQLAEYVKVEQQQLQDEVQSLVKNVEHINEIVAMQQSYAKVAGVIERISLTEVVEDALRMHSGAYARHAIRVTRDYAELPPVHVDRHRILEILVNLFSNAKYACHDAQCPEKCITIRIGHAGVNRVKIEVSDNGIGIPSENLTRIFSHGFTTRKKGHGFGLHSSALAAKELGGSLTAHSDGPGQGATFILELPTEPPHMPEPKEA